MVITTTAERTFEKNCLDIVGPVDLSCKGNSYILTIQDDLSKYSTSVPLPDHTAGTVSQAFIEHFVCLFTWNTELNRHRPRPGVHG